MSEEPIQPENDAEKEKKTTRITIKPPLKKSETARIDLASAKPPPSIVDKEKLPADAADYFGRSTMRIETGPADKKSETARIELPPEAAKAKTSKIDLASAPEIFKATTMAIGVPATPPPAAKPLRPKTVMVKRPGAPAGPGESIIVSPATTASAAEQARKSETARIDLSAEELERPATRPKTIRIKRPDGTTGRKPLAISRPESEEAAPARVSAPLAAAHAGEEEQPGLLVGITAIAATIVAGILMYVLLAQTLAPGLPFPGKI